MYAAYTFMRSIVAVGVLAKNGQRIKIQSKDGDVVRRSDTNEAIAIVSNAIQVLSETHMSNIEYTVRRSH